MTGLSPMCVKITGWCPHLCHGRPVTAQPTLWKKNAFVSMGYETHAIFMSRQQHPLKPSKPLVLPYFIGVPSSMEYSPGERHLLSSGGRLDFSVLYQYYSPTGV